MNIRRKHSRARALAILAAGVIGLAACGSSAPKAKAGDGAGTTTTTAAPSTTSAHGMDHSAHDMGHDGGDTAKPKPLAVLPNGLIDVSKIDLGGTPGVTAEQQKAAENLVRETVTTLVKWSNYDDAVQDGFKSISDQFTGEEHLIHWDWIEDDTIFDPSKPESLVYKVEGDKRILEAAMFLLPSKYTLDNPPTTFGKLAQYHIHNDLCFTAPPERFVRGTVNAQGGCDAPLVKFQENSMVHVWIRANECGPFAALIIGAGQTKDGTRQCDHAHGASL